MAEEKSMRLSQVAKILNKGLSSVAGSLSAKGFKVEVNPNTKINTATGTNYSQPKLDRFDSSYPWSHAFTLSAFFVSS